MTKSTKTMKICWIRENAWNIYLVTKNNIKCAWKSHTRSLRANKPYITISHFFLALKSCNPDIYHSKYMILMHILDKVASKLLNLHSCVKYVQTCSERWKKKYTQMLNHHVSLWYRLQKMWNVLQNPMLLTMCCEMSLESQKQHDFGRFTCSPRVETVPYCKNDIRDRVRNWTRARGPLL